MPESLPPKNRACDFHRTRLTHNKSFLHGSRFHHFQTKTMNSLVTRWMKQDSIAKGIGAAIGSMDEMMIVPSSIDVHRVAAQPAPALLVRVQLGPLLLISHVAYHTSLSELLAIHLPFRVVGVIYPLDLAVSFDRSGG